MSYEFYNTLIIIDWHVSKAAFIYKGLLKQLISRKNRIKEWFSQILKFTIVNLPFIGYNYVVIGTRI
jgi:hypothetical protein